MKKPTKAQIAAHNEAFAEGSAAFKAGKPLSSNRYESVRLHEAFKSGWNDAATDASIAKVLAPAAPTKDDKRLNALRELVRAEQARLRALADLQVQMPADLSHAAFEAMRGYANILANSKDWRDIGAGHVVALLDVIKHA